MVLMHHFKCRSLHDTSAINNHPAFRATCQIPGCTTTRCRHCHTPVAKSFFCFYVPVSAVRIHKCIISHAHFISEITYTFKNDHLGDLALLDSSQWRFRQNSRFSGNLGGSATWGEYVFCNCKIIHHEYFIWLIPVDSKFESLYANKIKIWD